MDTWVVGSVWHKGCCRVHLVHQGPTKAPPPDGAVFLSGGAMRRPLTLILFGNLEGLRYTATEFILSDKVTPPWPVGWARGGEPRHPLAVHLHRIPVLC